MLNMTKRGYEALKRQFDEQMKKEEQDQKEQEKRAKDQYNVWQCLPGGVEVCGNWQKSILDWI